MRIRIARTESSDASVNYLLVFKIINQTIIIIVIVVVVIIIIIVVVVVIIIICSRRQLLRGDGYEKNGLHCPRSFVKSIAPFSVSPNSMP